MKQPLISRLLPLNTALRYSPLQGVYTTSDTNEGWVKAVMPTNGTISRLFAEAKVAPGAGKSWTVTLRVNGADTLLACTIADAAIANSDTVDSIDVVAGDLVNIKVTPSGTPAAGNIYFSTQFTGTTGGESIQLGTSGGQQLTVDTTEYHNIQAAGGAFAIAAEVGQLVAAPGTFKKLYVQLSEDPGTAPDAYQFTVRKEGAPTALTCTITADNTTGNDTVNSFVVAAGDIVDFEYVPLNTPSETPYPCWGVVFVADIDGESLLLSGSDNDLDSQDTEYNGLACGGKTWDDEEIKRKTICNACTFKNLYIKITAAPNVDKSRAFTIRREEASSTLTCTIADANTTCNDLVNTVAITDGDTVAIMTVPTGWPGIALADAYWGLVMYIAPAEAPAEAPPTGLGSQPLAKGGIGRPHGGRLGIGGGTSFGG